MSKFDDEILLPFDHIVRAHPAGYLAAIVRTDLIPPVGF
jgi:hypothetical protein